LSTSTEPTSGIADVRDELRCERALGAPFVSILINNYNYGRFLGDAIRSALGQSYANLEAVVVDDGSTDNSVETTQAFGDVVHLIAKENGGQASAFNAGFAASRGEIICLLDSDDEFLPGKVERIVEVFRQNPEIGWCFENLKLFRDSKSERISRDRYFAPESVDARESMLSGVFPANIDSASSGLSFSRPS
jgi:glycosyltransferase involved in cell wall biosynthesis